MKIKIAMLQILSLLAISCFQMSPVFAANFDECELRYGKEKCLQMRLNACYSEHSGCIFFVQNDPEIIINPHTKESCVKEWLNYCETELDRCVLCNGMPKDSCNTPERKQAGQEYYICMGL